MPTAGEHNYAAVEGCSQRQADSYANQAQLNDVQLELVMLPACYGGMSLNDPVSDSHRKHSASLECTTRFTALIIQGEFELPRKAFFDTRVFYPHVPSYRSRALPSLYRQFIW